MRPTTFPGHRVVALVLSAGLLAGPAFAATPAEWALGYEGKSTNAFAWDKRTVSLVRTRVPAGLSDKVLAGLGGAPDPLFVTAHRYVSVSACVTHNCWDKAFFWLDAAYDDIDKLTLGSNGMAASTIPEPARRALIDWISEHDMKPGSVSFVGSDNAASALAPSDFQPRQKFQPAPGGPSFDCGGKLGAIETAVCADPGLKALDLELAQVFEKVRRMQSTVGDRQQLVDLQRGWLKTRNANCTQAPSMHDCLSNAYTAQRDRILNWVPTN